MSAYLDKYYPWVVLGAFSVLFFLATGFTFTSLGVVLPEMVTDLGWSWSTAGLGFTLLGLAAGLSSWPPSVTIRRLGLKATVLIGTLIMTAGFMCAYWVASTWDYFLSMILLGTGFSFLSTVPGTYAIAKVFERRATAFGAYFTVGGLGGVFGPIVYYAAVSVWDDWRMHWLLCALITLVCGTITAFLVHDRAEVDEARAEELDRQALENSSPAVHRTRQTWTVKQALKTPQYYVVCIAYASFLFCGITMNSLSGGHLAGLGYAAGLISFLYSLESALNAVARVISGYVGEFVEPKLILAVSLCLLVAGMIGLAIASNWFWLTVFVLGIGLGYGVTFLCTSVLLMNYYGRGPYLELFSYMNVGSTIASCAPLIGGLIRDGFGSFVPAFLLIAAIPFLVLIAVIFMRPPRLSENTEEEASVNKTMTPSPAQSSHR